MPPYWWQRSMVSAQLSKTNKGVDDENHILSFCQKAYSI